MGDGKGSAHVAKCELGVVQNRGGGGNNPEGGVTDLHSILHRIRQRL
jgi:hypothetical protein